MNSYFFDKTNCFFECLKMLASCCCLLIGIKEMRKCCLILWMIFSYHGSECFHMIRFYSINFLLNFCLRFKFGCFHSASDSVVNNHIFNALFKGYGNFKFLFLCSMCYDKNSFGGSISALISSERRSVSYLRRARSIPIFFNYSYFSLNFFNYSCCWSDK